jgi:DNA mismatch endonuclease (patch repair protein)
VFFDYDAGSICVSAQTRSLVMSKVKSRGNRSTEWRLRGLVVRNGLSGWKVGSEDVPGVPDFIFPLERLAIFTDGCFWHRCPRCKKIPSSNASYWDHKIGRNRKRDKVVSKALRRQGWTVLRFWEYALREPTKVIGRIQAHLDQKRGGLTTLRSSFARR